MDIEKGKGKNMMRKVNLYLKDSINMERSWYCLFSTTKTDNGDQWFPHTTRQLPTIHIDKIETGTENNEQGYIIEWNGLSSGSTSQFEWSIYSIKMNRIYTIIMTTIYSSFTWTKALHNIET